MSNNRGYAVLRRVTVSAGLAMTLLAPVSAPASAAETMSVVAAASDLRSPVLRWTIVVLVIAIVPLTGVLIGLSATLRDQATLDRLFGVRPNGPPLPSDRVKDLTPMVRRLRRQSLLRSLAILVVATAISVLAWYVTTLLKLPPLLDLLLVPAALALTTIGYLTWLRRRADLLPFERQPVVPALIGTLGALAVTFAASYAVWCVIGILIFSWVFLMIPFSIRGIVPFLVMVCIASFFMYSGLKILRFTAVPIDLARRLVAGSVEDALEGDRRREVLFLRSFDDDDLTVRSHRSVRHSPVELATTQPFERFEVILTWALWRLGPVCAIGRPNTGQRLQPLGAAREYYSNDTWQEAAHGRIAGSALVVLVLGRTKGLQWEIENARSQGVLGKCVFVLPPVDPLESAQRLAQLGVVLGVGPTGLPSVVGKGRHVIGVYFTEAGEPVLSCADGRDDLAYQALIAFSIDELACGGGELVERLPGLRSVQPGPTGERLSDMVFQITEDYESLAPTPTDHLPVRGGLGFIRRSTVRRLTGHRGSSADDVEAVKHVRSQIYALIQDGNWETIFDVYLSPQSKRATSRDVWVAAHREQANGRDYSGPEGLTVSVRGGTAVVQVEAFDGTPTPRLAFVLTRDGWRADTG